MDDQNRSETGEQIGYLGMFWVYSQYIKGHLTETNTFVEILTLTPL